MDPVKRNVALLSACQGLLLCNAVTLVTVNSLVGYQLAADKRLATLPVTGYVIGTTLATLPAAHFMKRYGRRNGFMLGCGLGIAGGLVCVLAVWLHSFWLLCLGTVLAGAYNAFGLQYRFAAADLASSDWKAKAISFTLAGGILGGVLGPETGKLTRDLLAIPFMGSYAALAGFALLAMLITSFLRIPPLPVAEQRGTGRSLATIARQPAFLVAVACAALGYGAMNLLMSSTPLAMDLCGLSFAETAPVFEWHVIGMYAPSFFTGSLIRRFGVLQVMLGGAACMFACVGVAVSGQSLSQFWGALLLLGIGWNFLYIGGTTLLTETYATSERAKVQGSNDFIVFGLQGISSVSSGAVLIHSGWTTLNLLILPMVLLAALSASWLLWLRRNRALPQGAG